MNNKRLNTDPNGNISAMTDENLAQIELLSTYIDGEATPEEARQVQELLDHDPEFKRQYLHLHQIRQGLQAMPTPASQSHRQLSNQVFTRLRWRRGKVVSLWGVQLVGRVPSLPLRRQQILAQYHPYGGCGVLADQVGRGVVLQRRR